MRILLVITAAFILENVLNTLLSVSKVNQCINTPQNCTEIITISFELQNNQTLVNSEKFTANIKNLEFANGELKELESQVNITLTKSPVIIEYNLFNPVRYNYHPHEIVLDSSWIFCDGESNLGDENPIGSSCNELYDETGNKIKFSSGFCCNCPLATTVFGVTYGVKRGRCELFSSMKTVHCMRNDRSWYNGFQVGHNMAVYNITVYVDGVDQHGQKFQSQTL